MNIGEMIDDLIDDPQTTDDRQLVCFSATNFERASRSRLLAATFAPAQTDAKSMDAGLNPPLRQRSSTVIPVGIEAPMLICGAWRLAQVFPMMVCLARKVQGIGSRPMPEPDPGS